MTKQRHYAFERDETGMVTRMVWLGDFERPPAPPCAFSFKTRGGEQYRCKLASDHKGPHEFIE